MEIQLSLIIDGEETTISKKSFEGDYRDILKLVEKACITHDYTFPEFVKAYSQVLQKVTKMQKGEEESLTLELGDAIIPMDDGSVN